MGAGASAATNAEEEQKEGGLVAGALLIEGARGLKDKDGGPFGGTSDPYVKCRLGEPSSSWEIKDRATERLSVTVGNTSAPRWQLAFPFRLPDGRRAEDWELHLRVLDDDLLTADDLLGEARIPLSALLAHHDVSQAYPLQLGGREGEFGEVLVMTGATVEETLAHECRATMDAELPADEDEEGAAAAGDCGPRGAFTRFLGFPTRAICRLAEFFTTGPSLSQYYFNQALFGVACAKPVGGADNDPKALFFDTRTTVAGVNTYTWAGPEPETMITLTGHDDCAQRLREFGGRKARGEVLRGNFLGAQMLNGAIWPEVPWHTIGLGMPSEAHALVRPVIDKAVGPRGRWSRQLVNQRAEEFFRGRHTFQVGTDVTEWTTMLLHEIHLGIKLTAAEAEEFRLLQSSLLKIIGIPEAAIRSELVRHAVGLEAALETKAKFIARYKAALRTEFLEDMQGKSEEEVTAIASAFMDSLLFAGGVSVPTGLTFMLALPYSAWGAQHLPEGLSLDDSSVLPSYVFETIRRFPLVGNFVYSESDGKDTVLNLGMALRDERVWGEGAGQFVLRPMADYHKNFVGFADPALAPHNGSPHSHACPGKDLAFHIFVAFLKEFFAQAQGVPGGYKALWQCDKTPADLTITSFSPATFRLTKDESVALAPAQADRTGAELLEDLSPEERLQLAERVHANNAFDKVNAHTRFYIGVVQAAIKDLPVQRAREVVQVENITDKQSLADDSVTTPICNFKFCKVDEDLGKLARVLTLTKRLIFGTTKKWEWDEEKEELEWFGSAAEGVAAMQATFGRYLPVQYNAWETIESDEGTVAFMTHGAAAWYLSAVRPDPGHEVPKGAVMEVNLEHMGQYETRNSWIKYGHTAYLGLPEGQGGAAAPDSPQPQPELLGVWSCQHEQLVRPGDPLWDHAKAAFRMTVVTNLTLESHLLEVHWIKANGLVTAAREQLSAGHPLRRFVKPFCFGTSQINLSSASMLMPPSQFAHRTFAFTAESWLQYFQDRCAAWRWVPLPERLARANLPAEFAERFAYGQEALRTWRVMEKYVRDFLAVFYPDGGPQVEDDAEIVAFWASFDGHSDATWDLPPLTAHTLTQLLTDMIWTVTAGHEAVGAIVEYLTSPTAFPAKLLDGRAESDVQSFAQGLVIIALTGVRQPALMDSWTHLLEDVDWPPEEQHRALEVARHFQADLGECADECDRANDIRAQRGEKKVVAFNPRILECSVSI